MTLTLSERLAEVMQAMGWKHADVLAISKESSSVVSQWLGKGSKPIKTMGSVVAAVRLARASGYAAEWIALGEGPRFERLVARENEPRGYLVSVAPLIPWFAAVAWAGDGPRSARAVEQWVSCPIAHSGRTFALRVRGSSMVSPSGAGPSYPDGSIIFVDPEGSSPDSGRRVIARLSGSGEVVSREFAHEAGQYWLLALNPTHPPIGDAFTVLGTVVGKWEDEAAS